MTPHPKAEDRDSRGSGKLQGKVALITSGDRGIGRAIARAFATAGTDVAVAYLREHEDAQETRASVAQEGRRCRLRAGDVGDARFCQYMMHEIVRACGRLDIMVNHAAEPHPQERLEQITGAQLARTFRTHIFSDFYMATAALSHLREGSAIFNTTSVTAYRGRPHLLGYAATKGAIVASRAASLVPPSIPCHA
jgi:NAD(P)-dependent dehydrogenase (short-subunit alcohol dehydrogenase family)